MTAKYEGSSPRRGMVKKVMTLKDICELLNEIAGGGNKASRILARCAVVLALAVAPVIMPAVSAQELQEPFAGIENGRGLASAEAAGQKHDGDSQVIVSAGDSSMRSTVRSVADYEYRIYSEKVTITKYVGIDRDVTIPSSIDGYPVTSISYNAFSSNYWLTSVVIPDSVTSIGSSAFYGCTVLTSVVIPDSVTSIGYSAFYGCTGLASVVIGNSVTSIGDYAFKDCTGLTSVVIGNSVTSIGDYAFYSCTGLTSVVIPDSVTSIGDYAFYSCSSLTSAVIGNGVTSIGPRAFYGCTGLTSVVIPDSVTSIGELAFFGCSQLVAVSVSSSNAAYSSLDGVLFDKNQTVVIHCPATINSYYQLPGSVISIGASAFSGCTGLESVTIPGSVTSIGASAFFGCTGLAGVDIPGSVISIGASAFSGCTGLESVTLPGSVTSIGAGAFLGCRSLTSVTIPDSVTSIGESAFSGCSNLTNVVIPNSVISIEKRTFYNCPSVVRVEIPGNVISIGGEAFSGCSSLISVVIPGSVTSIGVKAFSGCSDLISVVIPDGVTNIGNSAFYRCTSLTSVVIPAGVTNIGDNTFSNCTSLTSVVIPDGVTSIGYSAFYDCRNLTSVVIPDGVTIIGNSAFYDCRNLTSVVIPDSVTSIGDQAFKYCRALTSVVIPGSVTMIGKETFSLCSSLTSVVIPDSVTFIGLEAFYGCSSLSSVAIPGDVTLFGNSVFKACSYLAVICFLGPPPALGGPDVFSGVPGIAYYISGTVGWPDEFGGIPTALWTSDATFYGNGGIPSLSEQTYNVGVAFAELPTVFRSGYAFTGWWTSPDGGTLVTEDTLVPLFTSEHVLYAHWELQPHHYIVTFDLGGLGTHTGGGELQQVIAEGMGATPPEVAVEPGWSFLGWDQDTKPVYDHVTIRAMYSNTRMLHAGWNLISSRLNLTETSQLELRNKRAMKLSSSDESYVLCDKLSVFEACWVFAPSVEEFTLAGTGENDLDFATNLQPGWNFVGPVVDSRLNGAGAIAWGWNGQYYFPTEMMRGGSGYYLYRPDDQAEVTPVAGGEYLVVDLSGGPMATSYPLSSFAAVPAGGWTDEYKTTKLVLRRISAGTFVMGSPADELGRGSDETQHQVTLTQDFYIGVFEVTQKQWERVMGNWPSHFYNVDYRNTRPVEWVSYYDIRGSADGAGWPASNAVDEESFLDLLRARTGLMLDLPTEAQWEYACRAGTATALNSGKNLTNAEQCPNVSEVGRYSHNGGSDGSQGVSTEGGTAKVGSYLPNQWGLYDMHGNVWEWCLDWYQADFGSSAQTDPKGAAGGSSRVRRGGSWSYSSMRSRSAARFRPLPSSRCHD